MSELLKRALRASLFNRKAYDGVRFDTDATADAAMVVIAVTAATFLLRSLLTLGFSGLLVGLIQAAIFGLAQWLFLGLATWFAGTRLFGGQGDMQMVLRTHGLVYLPVLLAVAGSAIGGIGQLWVLAAAAVATSEALSIDTKKGAFSVLTGAAILFVIGRIFRAPFFGF